MNKKQQRNDDLDIRSSRLKNCTAIQSPPYSPHIPNN